MLQVVQKIIYLWGTKKKFSITRNFKFKEAKLLMLSSKKAKKELNWSHKLSFDETIEMTDDWYKSIFYHKLKYFLIYILTTHYRPL